MCEVHALCTRIYSSFQLENFGALLPGQHMNHTMTEVAVEEGTIRTGELKRSK